jgi:hypothetical protein
MKNSLLVGAVLFFVAAAPNAFAQGHPCPHAVPFPGADVRSPQAMLIPDDVCDPENVGVPKNLAYFDDYSWRAFIALVWPAAEGKRGVPDVAQKLEREQGGMPNGPPLVFETFKAEWETFPQHAEAHPTDWDARDDPGEMTSMWTDLQRHCRDGSVSAKPGDFFLTPRTSFGEFENVRQAPFPATALVAQNGTLVRYLAAYNEKAYRYIFARQLYLAENLPKDEKQALAFPFGSVTVKSSWIDLGKPGETASVAHPESSHRRLAWLFDPFGQKCEQHVVGLVGLHLVQKTPKRPAWVWSSFEHVANVPNRKSPAARDHPASFDNVCPPRANTTSPYSFNDGTGAAMKEVPPNYLVDRWQTNPPPCTPPPVNVERQRAINHDPPAIVTRNTVETNSKWQEALRSDGSVWQNYQLVLTQWSTGGRCLHGCGVPEFSVPGRDVNPCPSRRPACNRLGNSAIVNTSMETWLPDKIESGCMACHNRVASGRDDPPNNKDPLDYVLSLRASAYPPRNARPEPR